MSNINDTYFDGYYKELWRSSIPAALTDKEVDFMIKHFNLQPGCKVLDLMCGYGRHAIGLARKGIAVTAIDNLADYIQEIKNSADKEALPIIATQESVVNYTIENTFELAICMGNSLNFFNAIDCAKIISNVAAHLKPGGKLFVNSWSIAEIIFKSFAEKSEFMKDGYKFLSESKIFFQPARMESETVIIAPDGSKEEKKAIDYIYSINEIENFLIKSGLVLKDLYSIPGRKNFTAGEPRVYFIAEKE